MNFDFYIVKKVRKMLIDFVLKTEADNALVLRRDLQLVDENQGHSLLTEELDRDHVVNNRYHWGPVLKHFGNSINKI